MWFNAIFGKVYCVIISLHMYYILIIINFYTHLYINSIYMYDSYPMKFIKCNIYKTDYYEENIENTFEFSIVIRSIKF